MNIKQRLLNIKESLPEHVNLVAVSKTKSKEEIMQAYLAGQRVFGENKVQEMVDKWEQLPKDIQWHMIGHLQRNKVKYMAPFVSLIHGVDSLKLLKEINKQALKVDRVISCLLQVRIAEEETKFGLKTEELEDLIASDTFKKLQAVKVVGLMGMATFTQDTKQIAQEFSHLNTIFESLKSTYPKTENFELTVRSMGMSGDYKIAIQCGSTMVRIGSHIFGSRNYN
ncbi:YggS family pyridoxal phosphate-dependent enzyme [Galbibacter sp.]|uniref:YggS family pyridoxal phosphate-dependent enzyme n=1 Tax=Galbibacter sp. TaxID=2918471 RepID=UPI002CF5EB63|nr:YggS family pyridoxal phosphate-dependent enzyme [Galbibacter sp.]HLV63264.1 YggS family pyridoxal phosphate-dependent enzyme [Galbibacter sp.]